MTSPSKSRPRLYLLLSPLAVALLLLDSNSYCHSTRSQITHDRLTPSRADYACQPIGPCQPCPPNQLTDPVCELYYNRRLVDCIYLGNATFTANDNQTQSNPKEVLDHKNQIVSGEGTAEFQTWEACERVVSKEQQDFYEFVLCNVAIAAISLLVYGFRTKQLVVKQYKNLAARIGILPT